MPSQASGNVLRAIIADTAELNLDALVANRLRSGVVAAHRDTELRQALDATAIDADKVRMLITSVSIVYRLKTPRVVADIGAAQEAGIGHVDQVAVECGTIPGLVAELFYHLCMAQGDIVLAQQPQHCNPGWRGTQAVITNGSAQLVERGFLCASWHGNNLP